MQSTTCIMTSGTTGKPTIMMLSHENLLAASNDNVLRIERANRKGSVTTQIYDAVISEVNQSQIKQYLV